MRPTIFQALDVDAEPCDLQVLSQIYCPPRVGLAAGRHTSVQVKVYGQRRVGIGGISKVAIYRPRGLIFGESKIQIPWLPSCKYVCLSIKPGRVYHKQVSWAGTRNYTPQILWVVFTSTCLLYLSLFHMYSYKQPAMVI